MLLTGIGLIFSIWLKTKRLLPFVDEGSASAIAKTEGYEIPGLDMKLCKVD